MDSLSQITLFGNTPEKTCSKCGKPFPATPKFFQRDRHTKDSLRPDCKSCRAQWNAERREEKHAYNQAYYHDTPENRERILAQHKEQYYGNPEARQRALDYNKLPKVREYQRTYLKEYNKRPESRARNRANKHTYRAREKSVLGTHTREDIQAQLKRQKHKCYYAACGYAKFEKRKDGTYLYHVEHTYPISRVAGTDIPANAKDYLVLACPKCNRDKSDKFPWEWPEGGRLF